MVLITPDNYETIARSMRALHAQENRHEIEVLICAPNRDCIGAEREEWRDFSSVRIIEIGVLRVIAEAKARAVREASAPVVAFTEEHSFPARGWAKALLRRHQEDHAAVGPQMVNPNPRLPVSWANFAIEYGPWIAPAKTGPRSHIPGNNSSYKRDLLLAFGDRLGTVLDAETLMQWELAAAGHTLYLEAAAATHHINITRRDSFRRVHFQYGRMFAAQRATHWGLFKRLLYGCGAPLIPLVRLLRILPDIKRNPKMPKSHPEFWAYLLLGLIESAAGEALGYFAGAGDSRRHIFELEFHRIMHLDPRDTIAEIG